MGWDQDLLQRAVDQCTNDSGRVEDCPVFNLIPDSQAEGCRIEPEVDEPVSGNLTALPGCNPVQPGPTAKPQSGCGAPTTITPSKETFYTDLTSQGWAYTGCGTDNYYNRIFTGASEANDQMTNENCVAFCESKGFSIAGTEYARECYCKPPPFPPLKVVQRSQNAYICLGGNSIPPSGAPTPGVVGSCQMQCMGNNSEFCGGAGTISLYQRCTGTSCTNAQIGVAPRQVANPPPTTSVSAVSSSSPPPSSASEASSPTTLYTVKTSQVAAAPTTTSTTQPDITASVDSASPSSP